MLNNLRQFRAYAVQESAEELERLQLALHTARLALEAERAAAGGLAEELRAAYSRAAVFEGLLAETSTAADDEISQLKRVRLYRTLCLLWACLLMSPFLPEL